MLRAGALTELLQFYSRAEISDVRGTRRGAWELQFSAWAEVRLRPGSEAFAAARIEGRVPASVRIRFTPEAAQIGTGWMARDARGVEWNIQAPMPDPLDRATLTFTMVAGGPVG